MTNKGEDGLNIEENWNFEKEGVLPYVMGRGAEKQLGESKRDDPEFWGLDWNGFAGYLQLEGTERKWWKMEMEWESATNTENYLKYHTYLQEKKKTFHKQNWN